MIKNPFTTPTKRTVTRAAQIVAAGAILTLGLTACASGDANDSGSADSKDFGKASIQLAWIKNSEFMGEFMADKNGYFTDAGFDSVNLVAGPPTSPEATVLAGTVDMALGNAVSTGTVIASEGAPLKIIGATYQKNPFTILSLEDVGNINTIEAIKGKTIGVQASNLNLWQAFLKINNISEDEVTTLPVEYDPTALFTGQVDGWFSYLTNETLDAQLQDLKPVTLPLADNGLPFVAETFTVTDDAIKNDREKLKAILVAEIRGWTDAINDPEEGAKISVEEYGKDLGLSMDKELLQAQIQATDLVISDETKANGLFTISEDLQNQSIATLAAAGIDVTTAQMFDMSLLAEVYEENPDLVDYSAK